MKHFKIRFEPAGSEVYIHAGATILEAASQAGIVLNTVCGGKGICGKCKVILQPSGSQVQACQHTIQSNLTVTVPATSSFYRQKILAAGIDIQQKFKAGITAETRTAAEAGFGVAVDIGTTTVVAKLVDMSSGRTLATEAAPNPQSRYGDDVISRISYAQTEDKYQQLHASIIKCVNRLIEKLCQNTSIKPEQIFHTCIVGNTTMNHLFLRFPVTGLGQAPYNAYNLKARDVSAQELGLNINSEANVHSAANIAGFVGSDITAAALASGIDSENEMTLLADIGTNGEIVLGSKEKLYAASCAAGPAFEGGRISCGSRAVEGAIEAVVFDDRLDIDFDVIGGTDARSICGSGLIDAVALMVELGVVDQSGKLIQPTSLRQSVFAELLSRIIEFEHQPAFVLVDDKQNRRKVILTQADIRQTQLAKSAVRTGIKLLQQKLSIRDDDIEKLLLAGAFGNYIRPDSAVRIGLLPDVGTERIHFIGNAAASGAQLMLLSTNARKQAAELAEKIEYVEIATEPNFTEIFAEQMAF